MTGGTEHAALRSSFSRIVSTLKSKPNRKHALPWYLLLGLCSSGKTTLLQHERGIDSIGGHQEAGHDCHWWLADGAVLVDVGGGYLQQHDDGNGGQWQAFVSLLRRFRKSSSTNAAIIVISAPDLLTDDADALQRYALGLKQHLQMLQQACRKQLPCYIVISKCDAVTGLADFLLSTPQSHGGHVLGVSLPNDAGINEIPPRLHALGRALQTQLPQRLQAERNAHSRRAMLELPLNFARLQQTVASISGLVFCRAHSAEAPLLRGIYFVAAAAQPGRQTAPALIHDVILADPLPHLRPQRNAPTRVVSRLLPALAGIGVFVLIALWLAAFTVERQYVDKAAQLLQRHRYVQSHGHMTLSQADDTISMLERAQRLTQDKSRWSAFLGMRDKRLDDTLATVYDSALQQYWLPAFSRHLQKKVLALNENDETTFLALKAWLMLVKPRYRDMAWLQHWLQTSGTFNASRESAIVERLLQLHMRNPGFAAPFINRAAISSLQQRLGAIPLEERLYATWKSQYGHRMYSIHPLLGAQAAVVFSIRDAANWNMPLLYTANTHGELAMKSTMSALRKMQQQQWVLGSVAGTPDESELQKAAARLHARYAKDYADAWSNLLSAISLRETTDATSLLALLQPLSSLESSPLARLLAITQQNLKVLDDGNPLAALGSDRTMAVTATLAELRGWLNAVYLSSDAGNTAQQKIAESAVLSPPQKTLVVSQDLPAPFSHWISSLARAASNSITSTASSSLSLAWRQQVADFCQARIGGRYPFKARAQQTVGFGDFVDYFRPGGIEDTFVRTRLGNIVDRNSWAVQPNASARLSAHALDMLQRAQQIRDAFFGEAGAGFSYQVTPLRMNARLQKFSLQADNARFEYSHGPRQPTRFSWPQTSLLLSTQFTSLRGSKVTKTHEGTWGVYRLIDAAQQVTHEGSQTAHVVLSSGIYEIELALSVIGAATHGAGRAVSTGGQAINPLRRDLLTNYECVTHLH